MLEIGLGDTIRLRKKHPCGGYDWKVVRLGADIGLVCDTCQRRVLLDRLVVERRAREVIRATAQEDEPESGGAG